MLYLPKADPPGLKNFEHEIACFVHLVTVRNVGLRGKQKLADRWNKHPYIVIDQPIEDVPVFAVKREHGRGRRKLLHLP